MNEYLWPPPTAPKAARAFDHITEAEECRQAAQAWGAPVRANAPLAGADRYEPGEAVTQTVQAARTKLVITVLLVCVVVLVGLVYVGLRWRMGATWQ